MIRTRAAAVWVWLVLHAARHLVRAYPHDVAVAVGPELIDAIRDRLATCGARSGLRRALRLGVAELADLVVSGFEARRELARGVRLGSPGHVGVDPTAGVGAFVHDSVDAVRGLARTPGPTLMIVGLIALGVGASASIFGVVDDVLIEPLPFDASDELVHVWSSRPWLEEDRGLLADVQVQSLERNAETLDAVSALWMVSGRILGGDRPIHTDVGRVSTDFFDILGVEPILGRTFREGEDLPGAAWVALPTFEAWQRDFGGDPDVVGRTVTIGWYEMEIVGVLPPGFHFVIPDELGAHGVPDLWIPWRHRGNEGARVGGGTLAAVARLAPGASLADASHELAELAVVEDRLHYGGRGFGYSIERLQDAWVVETRPGLMVLSAAVFVLFLIAVANASTLLLTRTQLRRSELGLRRVLGATPLRLSRLLALEAFVIAAAAGPLGYVISFGGTAALRSLAPPELPLLGAGRPDLTVFTFALAAAMFAALVSVGAPALRQSRFDPSATFRAGGGPARTESRAVGRARGLLVMAQVSLSVILLVGAGLLVRTFEAVRASDLGFAETDRVSFSIYLMDEYDSHEMPVAFYDELRTRLREVDGVLAVSGTSALPLSDGAPRAPVSTFAPNADVDPREFFLTEGFSVLGAQVLDGTRGDGWVLADLTAAHPGYFEAIGALLLAGRTIGEADRMTAKLSVVIDEVLAAELWQDAEAVGQRLWVAGAWREVVGVVAHARLRHVRSEARPQAYLPNSQVQSGRVSMVVHSARPIEALIQDVRAAVAEIDPLVPIADVTTVERTVSEAEARDRFGMATMTAFAVLATALVALGLYGSLSYVVGERLREFAVRRVVGSGRMRVASIVARVVLRTVGGGLLLGSLAALVAVRAIEPLLFGVSSTDAIAIATTLVVLLGVTVAACWWPVRRAMDADPVKVLRMG